MPTVLITTKVSFQFGNIILTLTAHTFFSKTQVETNCICNPRFDSIFLSFQVVNW